MNKRCLGCMEEYNQEYGVCPHCGYVEGTEVEEAVHMEPGTTLADRYTIGKVLGYGGFGVTYIAWDKLLEQKVAIKEYLPSEFSTRMPGDPTVTVFSGDRNEQFNEGLDKFVEEAKRLSKFQNEAGIVKVFDSFKSNNTAYIVMEYLDGETLTSYMEREGLIPEDKAVEMLAPVMVSLQTVHEAGILHRDIAPDNIFLTKNGEVKLIDFGASRYATTSHSRSLTVIIKPGYSPEEQYRSRGDQGPHTDVYALAAVMYKMITGITPPDALERRAVIETKKKELLKDIHKTNKTISPNIENAILNAMNVQIEDRTADIISFMAELNSTTPVKRRYGKIKKIDVYAWPIWMKIVIPAIVVAFLTTAILLVTGVIDFPSLFSGKIVVPEGMVIVPDVEGMTADDALETVNNANLMPSPSGNVESDYVEAGKIVFQSPSGGMYLEKYGEVVLTVSSGTGVVGPVNGISTVPYIVWDTAENALAKLKKAGLADPIIETEYDENVPKGQVVSQSVSTGTKVDEGTQITIVVSKGPKPFAMPNVVGKTKTAAESELASKGLAVYFEYVTDDSVAANTVLGQNVAEGTMVQKGDKITLKISTKTPTVTVANVVGKSKANAISTLEKQGFKVVVIEGSDGNTAEGNVISQTPAAGTSHLKGSTITITVSKGVQTVTVPNVIGTNTLYNCNEIRWAELKQKTVIEYSDTIEAKTVIRQVPAPGTIVEKGTEVTLYISGGRDPHKYPEEYYKYTVSNGKATITGLHKTLYGDVTLPNKLGGAVVTVIEAETFTLKSDISENGSYSSEPCCFKSVVIPDGVVSIKVRAFDYCPYLEKVTISKTVTDISFWAFRGCDWFGKATTIIIDSNNPKYHSSGNCIIETSSKKIVHGFSNSVIPSDGSVTTIGRMAFSAVSGIESIVIPDCITEIEEDAFDQCDDLKSVTIGKGVTVLKAGVFARCDFEEFVIPDHITKLEGGVFFGNLSLKSVTIPDSIVSIDKMVFWGCYNLTGIWVDKNNKYYYSDSKGVVYTKDNKTLVCAPGGLSGSYTIPNSVTSISDGAFYDCSNLTSITIPNSVTSIGDSAFYCCSNLTSITIPNSVTSIGSHAFNGCRNLTNITIPNSVTSIAHYTFSSCSSLTSITIPSSVTDIYSTAFNYCDKLTTVYFETEAQKEKFKDCFDSNVNLIVK